MKKIGILGIGNILFKDEGVGVFAVKYLEGNYKFNPNIDLIDAGTAGFGLMEYFEDYDNIILIDTISINDEPGSIYRLTPQQLVGIGSYHQTAHEVEVLQMLELSALKGKMADVVIIGVVPEDISKSEIGLTQSLEKNFNFLIETILNEIKKLNIKYKKVNKFSLEEIVLNFVGAYNGKFRY
ncbi:HyaD/HybD family hydrogenase maturation endopeptidase [Venenivibrio stagnispumantis]|uniref:Hydrogenase maturation protease n=1 Tax=Venenivibrio stagnispumantis TaxID=407998 RepID=A0AA45WMX5_9AQUI|nr:HyaD/HybD family hydrogenase maturation endopeptidase [Venenivibrio stagnispumantis]MCW4573081.1 HyaD/HybD family hydrogenase maturation endopeptidase [Venenivibrio stagnispumantis]SMP15198.1 hydrogenase maturation protease [Venenivibrio stagnispumantis]